MKLYQVIRQVVPDRAIYHDDASVSFTKGFSQVVWEGRSRYQATRQLDMAREVESPKGTICVVHSYEFSA